MMLPFKWKFFGERLHRILYFFGFCWEKFDIFWGFFPWLLKLGDSKSHFNSFEFTFSCCFLQAVEDSGSLPDAVLYSSIYLTKLAIMDAPKISHLVSWVKLFHWKWLDILSLAHKNNTHWYFSRLQSAALLGPVLFFPKKSLFGEDRRLIFRLAGGNWA